ncbi:MULTISPECIES: LysR family transcriptional regulator [Glycomyces]|uniref:LysR family transcriptional regulator n=1 Tax=Glycomyces artemisiae TaxID=1076443 RepID=A0A2T0UG81_9ACTN|nr:LysR family transcriptional regulator [Glycomyces artemisiae]NUQ87580.1 LysR family transcriptional regulator [Glycomyces artemisiae]PRY56866.1 molybdate transport repressor ModE-like protein [Glycomyces artemisiae]
MIDLRRLHVLRAIAHHGTVSGAAKALHMSTSAASQQIRLLSKDLGVPLLEPVGRGVRLSSAAQILIAHIDAIEAMWRLAEAELQATEGEPSGLLRLCGFPTAIATLLAPLVDAARDRYPSLELRLREAEASESFDLLFSGDADLALVEATPDNPPPEDIRFDSQTVFNDPFDLVVPADHWVAGADKADLRDLEREPWIIGVPGSIHRRHVLTACSNAGFRPTVTGEAREWPVIAVMVDHRMGVALIPRLVDLPHHLDLVRVPIGGPYTPYRHFRAVTLRGGARRPSVAAVMELLDERIRAAEGINPVA